MSVTSTNTWLPPPPPPPLLFTRLFFFTWFGSLLLVDRDDLASFSVALDVVLSLLGTGTGPEPLERFDALDSFLPSAFFLFDAEFSVASFIKEKRKKERK